MPVENITSSDRFTTLLQHNQNVLCFYYWKLCGHCIQFAPIWKSVIMQFKDKINVAQIELDSVRKLDHQYQVSAFPTIIVYRNGKKNAEFNKARTPEELIKFIKKNLLQNSANPKNIKAVPNKPRLAKKQQPKQT